jgi:glycosyltransferase involved in cell wall biosynthesis
MSVRVLFVNHTARVSGGELSLLGLLAALPPEVEAAVACPPGALAERLDAAGVARLPIGGTDGSLRLHPLRTPRALAEMAGAAVAVGRAADRFEADVVHANSIRAGLIAVAARAGGARPTVVHARDCLPPGPATSATLLTLARADAVIANSDHTRAALGPAAARARVVHNAIEVGRFAAPPLDRAAARARLGIEGEAPALAVIAQVTPWKGQDDAIRIAAGLRRRHPDLRLLLVGSPKFDSPSTRHDNASYLAGLHRQVAAAGLGDAVAFLGERDDLPEIFAALDLVLVPSWEEPFGRTVIEAMAAGVPVAATTVGGPAEILDHGRTGLLLPPREPWLWVEAIGPLLGDGVRRAEIATPAADEARRRFAIDRHVEAVLGVYASLGAPV